MGLSLCDRRQLAQAHRSREERLRHRLPDAIRLRTLPDRHARQSETAKNVRNVITSASIEAERREHSRKPDDQYSMCEALVPGAVHRLELFARTQREGWDCWGNETEKFAA